VSYVGSSSMEILIRIESLIRDTSDGSHKWELAVLACFTMVARHPVHRTAEPVPPLLLVTDEEKEIFKASEGIKINVPFCRI
jgi:acyl-CoA hydrolase